MKKTAILTFHNACNYGAFLQTYSLQRVLNELGAQAEICDYRSSTVESVYDPRSILKKKKNPIKKVLDFLLRYRDIVKRNRLFKEYQYKYLPIAKKNILKSELSDFAKGYDLFIVGSDQVWNRDIISGDNAFFLDFVSSPVKKYSYAASLGRSELSSEELSDIVPLFNRFDGISVREEDILPQLNKHLDKQAVCCLDPVFLTSAEQWRKFSRYKKREPYVLFFMMGTSPTAFPAMEFAKKLAAQKGLKAVYLSDQERWYRFRDLEHFGVADPSEFLGLIDNAEYVVTNSFHASAFSIILHKDFYVESVIPRNGRILNLLKLTGLGDRALVKGVPADTLPIDWKSVDEKLSVQIGFSEEYLRSIIEERRDSFYLGAGNE